MFPFILYICRIQLPHPIRFHSSKEGPGLDLIWMAWSGFDTASKHPVWKQARVQEWSCPVLVECNQPATSFPLSNSAAFFHRWPGSYCAKTSPDLILDPAQKQACVQESSTMGLLLASASNPDRTGCESDPARLLGDGAVTSSWRVTMALCRESMDGGCMALLTNGSMRPSFSSYQNTKQNKNIYSITRHLFVILLSSIIFTYHYIIHLALILPLVVDWPQSTD